MVQFAVFTVEQLKAAAREIDLRVHEYDESLDIIDEETVYKILCKWTKEVPTGANHGVEEKSP